MWCEQQLVYEWKYSITGIRPEPEDPDVPLPLPTNERPEVIAGKSIHLAKGLYRFYNDRTTLDSGGIMIIVPHIRDGTKTYFDDVMNEVTHH